MSSKSKESMAKARKKGSFQELSVSRATRRKLEQCVWKVFVWLESTGRPAPQSFWTLEEVLWWSEFNGLTQAEYTLEGLHAPTHQVMGHMPGAWKRVSTWRKHGVPRRDRHLLSEVVQGMHGGSRSDAAQVAGLLGLAVGFPLHVARSRCVQLGGR